MTKLQYPGEHLACSRYDSGQSPLVEYVTYPMQHAWEEHLAETAIIFILKGSLSLTYEHFLGIKVSRGKIILLPPGCHYKAHTAEGCVAFVFRLSQIDHFCDRFSLERLALEEVDQERDLQVLNMTEIIENYILDLHGHHMQGLRCHMYHEIKVKEFFFLLRAYYPKKKLAGFFRPLLSNDCKFMNFVLQHYKKVKTVYEFAELYQCSVSSFDKKFRHTFGMAPYQWMIQKKIGTLYNEINTTDKPFLQIAKEQKFSSLPQFTDFCKKHFGYSPSKMRRLAAVGMVNGINVKE